MKKAWNRFKKSITANGDPLKLKGSMYMTSQQMEKRTATIALASVEKETETAKAKAEQILKSDAWKKLVEEIGIKSVSYEIKENAYYCKVMYMRINY